jgi:spermidine/putrescine-binding protein
MNRRSLISFLLVSIALLLLAGCAAPTAAPAPTQAPAQPTAAQAQPTAAPAADKVRVAILNKDMTKEEIAAAIKAEGSVIVANWTYTANDAIIKQFQDWVKKEYGVDVKLDYVPSQSPTIYLTNLYTAQKAGNPSPYDVLAIEENYYYDAKANGVVEDIYPSGLMPNWDRVDPQFRHDPQSVGFQSTATPSPIFHADKVGSWFKDWKDLADPRLKGRITMPLSGDVTAGGFLLGMAWSLGKDYKDEAQMTETIDFICTNVHPNVLKYTTDSAEMQQLLRSGDIDVAGFWNSLSRLEALSGADGTKDTTYMPMASGQAAVNGFMWVPKGAPHPVLAQLFIDWRLSDDGQLPGDAWGIPNNAWAEYVEGLMGPSYEQAIPAWIKPDFNKFYPPLADIKKVYKSVDWDYYAKHVDGWMKQYSKCAG